MSLDVIEFFKDHSISFATEGHKHCQPGWVQTECPFCSGNPGYHLGYNVSGDFFNCWRCGWHPTLEVIKVLSGLGWEDAKRIFTDYRGKVRTSLMPAKQSKARGWGTVELPYPISALTPKHFRYLRGRRFDARKISRIWDLRSAGPVGDYKHRIIAPIYFKNNIVSYQARIPIDGSDLPYKACKEENEIIHHKNILYGLDLAKSLHVVLVEGITDAWRMGPGAVASFGIKMKMSQILLLAEHYKFIHIMFDDDPQAIKEAEKIGTTLSMLDCEVDICLIKGDPGALSQKKADRYMKSLLR